MEKVMSDDKKMISASEVQLILFIVNEDKYAIDIMKTREIIKPIKVTPLPDVPDFIKGVINLRGTLLPVISMQERFGLSKDVETEISKDTRVIIVILNDMALGVIVDAVEEIIRVPIKDIQPPPKMGKDIDSKYLKGICRIGDDALVLLDLEKILSTSEKVMMKNIGGKGKGKGKKNEG